MSVVVCAAKRERRRSLASRGRSVLLSLVLTSAPLAAGGSQAPDETALIERIEIARNQYLQSETLLFYISTKAGDRYDELRLREDFRRLWDTGFLRGPRSSTCVTRPGGRWSLRGVRAQAHPDHRLPGQQGRSPPPPSRTSSRSGEADLQDRHLLRHRQGAAGGGRSSGRCWPRRAGRSRRCGTRPRRSGGAGMQVTFVIDDGPKARVEGDRFRGQRGVLRRQAARAA